MNLTVTQVTLALAPRFGPILEPNGHSQEKMSDS